MNYVDCVEYLFKFRIKYRKNINYDINYKLKKNNVSDRNLRNVLIYKRLSG